MNTSLATSLTSQLNLPTPLIAGSGSYGWGTELQDLTDSSRPGAIITPTLTLQSDPGNPMPRSAEASAGLLMAAGWPNPGVTHFLKELLPILRKLGPPIIVRIAASNEGSWERLAEEIGKAPGVAALELNLTPPNWTPPLPAFESLEQDEFLTGEWLETIRLVRSTCELPLLVYLPSGFGEIGALTRLAFAAGADVVSVGQAFPGVNVRPLERKFRFQNVAGALTGPCIKPLGLYQTWRARQAAGDRAILGGGGIMTLNDVLEYLSAGADAVVIGTANLIHPNILSTLTDELQRFVEEQGLQSLHELRINGSK